MEHNSDDSKRWISYQIGAEHIEKKDLKGFVDIFLQIDAEHSADTNGYPTRCIGCSSASLEGEHYKCLQCPHYELCPACFERRHESRRHSSGHAFARFLTPGELFDRKIVRADVTMEKLKERLKDSKHDQVTCDGCGIEPIVGLRFKCDQCNNYDLCSNCVEAGKTSKNHGTTHPLILINNVRLLDIDMTDIQLMDKLGSGAFGTVHKAKWISKDKIVACKVISIAPAQGDPAKSFLRELAAYNELSGAYILQTFGHGREMPKPGANRKFMLVMEFMERGNLKSLIKRKENLSIEQKVKMACNIASGMRKLHEHHMIHRDIRSDNILVNSDYVAKIGDMGIAREIDPERMEQMTMIGCTSYMPPEFYSSEYNQSLDVFTFGLTLYELFVGLTHEFDSSTFRIRLPQTCPVFDDLIKRCAHYHAAQRPSALEIETTLHLYRDTFAKIVTTKFLSYALLQSDEKDARFIEFYTSFSPIARHGLAQKFPAPPPTMAPEIDPKKILMRRLFSSLIGGASAKA